MKHTLKKLSETQLEITVLASSEDVHTAKVSALSRLARELKVPGFRKGKVPANVAEKHLDQNVLGNETIQFVIQKTLTEVVQVENLRVLDQPKIELKKFIPFDELEFTAVIDVIPEITLGNYTKLKVKRTIKKVEQSDVDDVLERVKQNFAEKKDVKRAAKLSDEVTIDFAGKKNGVAFDGGTSEDYQLVLGSNSFIPGFEDAVVGMKPGDKKSIPLTFPKDYHAKDLKGAKVEFDVTLKTVREVTTPELTDEVAGKVGPFTTVKELTEDIRRELTSQAEREADSVYKDDLVNALVKVSRVPVPDVLVEDQLKSIERDAKQNLMYRGQTPDEYMEQQGYADEAAWRDAEFRPTAIERVKAGLVLAELSKREHVEATKEELDARLAEMLQQYPTMKDQLDTPESRADLVNRLVTEKTLERLVELNA